MLRIIAGERRGHKIEGPAASSETRPTSDRVRESLFNILGELVVDRLVIDLFAGTGALGLEALSRGAARALFVERDRKCVALIHKNIATLRYEDRASVRLGDAYRWGGSFESLEDRPIVALLDPPYRDYETKGRRVHDLIDEFMKRSPPGSVIALESGQARDDQMLPEPEAWDVRRYGNTRIAIWLAKGALARHEALPQTESAEQSTPLDKDGPDVEL